MFNKCSSQGPDRDREIRHGKKKHNYSNPGIIFEKAFPHNQITLINGC